MFYLLICRSLNIRILNWIGAFRSAYYFLSAFYDSHERYVCLMSRYGLSIMNVACLIKKLEMWTFFLEWVPFFSLLSMDLLDFVSDQTNLKLTIQCLHQVQLDWFSITFSIFSLISLSSLKQTRQQFVPLLCQTFTLLSSNVTWQMPLKKASLLVSSLVDFRGFIYENSCEYLNVNWRVFMYVRFTFNLPCRKFATMYSSILN